MPGTPKIRITRKERKTGMIDSSKVPAMKTKVVTMHKEKPSSSVDLDFQRGKTTKTYTPSDVRTGDVRYGKEGSGETPDFVKKAQAAKQDIVHHKEKPYRAGFTTETKTPEKVSIRIKSTPSIKMHQHVPQNLSTAAQGDGANSGGKRPGKRRLPHVDYLEKVRRNKRTEAGN